MSNIIPISYLDERSKIGKVYLTGVEGPPLTFCPVSESSDNMHLAIEFENHINVVSGEDPVMRLCMHISDARKLCHNLITALASSGDTISTLIKSKMDEAMNDCIMRKQREDQDKSTLN